MSVSESLFYGAHLTVLIVKCSKSPAVTCLTGLYSDQVAGERLQRAHSQLQPSSSVVDLRRVTSWIEEDAVAYRLAAVKLSCRNIAGHTDTVSPVEQKSQKSQ